MNFVALDLRKRLLATHAAADWFALLVLGEHWIAPELRAAHLGAFAPLARAGADELAFELRKPAENLEHRASVMGVAPA